MSPTSTSLLANRLLSCPACAASSFAEGVATLVCERCGAEYAVQDGVIDFVGGRQTTLLDAVDYDDYYGVDDPKIARSFELVEQHVGTFLDRPLGSVLELGAGTGLLTASLVRRGSAERLLVTDVSPKMLLQCRKRVHSLAPDGRAQICFATNDGIGLAARPGEFDAVLGYFVVHHILEWRKTLGAVLTVTNDRGVAIFVEPNRRFHLALVLCMNRVLERLLPEMPDLPGSDLSSLLNLNGEWAFTLKYADQPSALAHQEDKHFFDRAEFERAFHEAGWPLTRTLRFDQKSGPLETANVYADQLKLSHKGRQRFMDVLLSELPGPFALLEDVDASPSYVFIAAKRQQELDLCSPQAAPTLAAIHFDEPETGDALIYDLDVTLTSTAPHVVVEGWIAAMRPVMRVVFQSGEFRASLLVGTRRVDVVRGMVRLRRHAFVNLLHSGIRGVEKTSGELSQSRSSRHLRIVAELDDGRQIVVVGERALDLAPDGSWKTRVSALG